MMWRERSGSKALVLCCSCGNGRPMFQNPLLNAQPSVWSLCCISSVHHAKLMLGAGCDRRAEVWEVCHGIMALKPEHNPPKEARISYRVTPFCLSSYMTNALHVGYCKPPMKSKARVSVSLGMKMRVAENVLSTSTGLGYQPVTILCGQRRTGQPWSAPPTPSNVAHSTEFGKVSRQLLTINNFEVFNELERGFLGGWFILCHLCCWLPNGVLIAFLLLVSQLKPLFTFASIFSTSLNFPYLLFNYDLAIFACCNLIAL